MRTKQAVRQKSGFQMTRIKDAIMYLETKIRCIVAGAKTNDLLGRGLIARGKKLLQNLLNSGHTGIVSCTEKRESRSSIQGDSSMG